MFYVAVIKRREVVLAGTVNKLMFLEILNMLIRSVSLNQLYVILKSFPSCNS